MRADAAAERTGDGQAGMLGCPTGKGSSGTRPDAGAVQRSGAAAGVVAFRPGAYPGPAPVSCVNGGANRPLWVALEVSPRRRSDDCAREQHDAAFAPPLSPSPFARDAPGVGMPAGGRPVVTSGQPGPCADGPAPAGAAQCLARCAAPAGVGIRPADAFRMEACMTDRAHMAGCVAARDAWLAGVARRPISSRSFPDSPGPHGCR